LADERVWRPDAIGSVAFLVASGLAWIAVRRELQPGHPRPRTWWMAVLNLLGSLAFGVSAVTAYIVPATGDMWHADLSNLGTLVGGVCFFAGAALLLPSRSRDDP
jgi:peptidoglycan/LPS O-acetylase OafA/YrhL